MLFEVLLYYVAPTLLIAGVAFFFAFRRAAPREDRAGSPATRALLVLVGVCLILVGAVACVLAPYFFALHGFAWESGSEPINGVAWGSFTLIMGIVVLGTGVFVIRTRRSPRGGLREDRSPQRRHPVS